MSGDLVQLGGGKPRQGSGRSRLPETPRLILTLTVAGLISGIAIVGAYEFTLPRIQANRAAALRRAVFQVVPGASRMQRLVWQGEALTPVDSAGGGSGEAGDQPSIYAAYGDGDRFAGYAIPAEGAGF